MAAIQNLIFQSKQTLGNVNMVYKIYFQYELSGPNWKSSMAAVLDYNQSQYSANSSQKYEKTVVTNTWILCERVTLV
jgi:hypothetical protein